MIPELLHVRLKRLYKQRKKQVKKLTIAKMAFILNISRQYVVYWLNGSRRIPEEYIDGICEKILKISVDDFLKNTIQISGKKKVINFSNTKLNDITELKHYPGLSLDEVKLVLEYKKNQVT